MNNHFVVAIKWGLATLCMFLYFPIFSQIKVNQFMGINARGQDPIARMKVVGTVREFHPWVFNEGFPNSGSASPNYPNNQYSWNPNYIDYIRFDDFYSEINGNGLTISPVTLRSIPQVVNPFLSQDDPSSESALAQKPVVGGENPLLPSSYIAHAAYLYQYAARYGHTVFNSTQQNVLIASKLAPNELAITGLGFIDYLENWNEPDQNDIFSPEEYAAMLSADYDGHAQTLGLVANPNNPSQLISTVGIKNADPNMKVVMSGLEDANLAYIRRIVNWSKANRPTNAPLPFDVINIHKYLGNNPDFHLSTSGISPEAGGLRDFLSTFVTYRDSLMPGTELWLSEFGYDTNNNSPISVPIIGNFTQYQVQGQWLVRSYLEVIAAGFDKAMIFDLRDVCTGPFCTLFTSAGLLETQFNDFKPKDAWYYVYTMKNVLTDMVFDADLSTCSDLSCPRVYRFIDPNNANKRIYAVWNPTSDGSTTNISLSLEGASIATLVEMGAPSIKGISSPLTGISPNVTVSESPVFVIVGDNSYTSGIGCSSNLTVTNQTCGSLKVNWVAPNGVDKFQLWYMEGHQTVSNFSLDNATLVVDEIPANLLSYTIADLPPNTPITLFLIPEGVAVASSNPNAAAICAIQTATLSIENTCQIPLAAAMIFDPFISLQNATRLVDEQMEVDPFCNPSLTPSTFWGFDFPADQSNTQERLSLDLGAYYDIDILALYDGGGIGVLDIQTANSPNGPWTTIRTYPTISTNDWRYFTNLFTANQPIRYLRFIASDDDMVQLGELFLCGELSTFTEDIAPRTVQNAAITANSCNSITIDVVAPFDRDIASYKVIYDNNKEQHFPFTEREQPLVLSDLPDGNTFDFSILTIDNIGQASLPFTITSNTLPSIECVVNCTPNCPTQLCLQPSWITDLTPIKPDDYNPARLVDEQATAPICGNSTNPFMEWGSEFDPSDGLPPVIAQLDLQAVYNLDTIFLFDGNSAGTFIIEYLDETGDWQPLFNYFTTAFNEWVSFQHPTVHARFLRITKMDSDANINEIVIHASPYISVDPPSGAITNLTANTINCTTANLNWTLPTNSNISQLKLVVTTTNSLVEINLPAIANSFMLNNLLPFTVYECFLFAENSSTTPTELDIITFQTATNNCGNNNPPIINNFKVAQTSCETVTLGWNVPTNNNIAYYQLNVQPNNLNLSFPPLVKPIKFEVNNLQGNTQYTFSLKAIDQNGNESTNKVTTATTEEADECDGEDNDNCNPACPTYICIETDWINDLTATNHLDARRLFDEPQLGNPICGEHGIPKRNWGEDYTPDSGIPPSIVIVDLQQLYNLTAIHLYDIESDGQFRVEYQNSSGNWVTITNYLTVKYRQWHELNNLNLTTRYLRFTKLQNSAKIGEVAIFGIPVNN